MTLTFGLTHDHDRGYFKVTFRNSCISGFVALIDVKWKESEFLWYWANGMTLPFGHFHDLDFGISRPESEIALLQEWGGWLTWKVKDENHPYVTVILTSMIMAGWADVPESDRGDFRRRGAVHISSSNSSVIFLTVPTTYFEVSIWYVTRSMTVNQLLFYAYNKQFVLAHQLLNTSLI